MREYVYVYAYSTGREGATNVRFSASYSVSVTLSNDMRNSISNFCVKMYLFPERVTYA